MNIPTVFTSAGGSGPTSPDNYDLNSNDILQERTNSKVSSSSVANKGVVLTKDSLDVPLEVQFNITNDRTESGRPTLPILVRIRDTDNAALKDDLALTFYQQFRSQLSPEMQERLLNDEEFSFQDRDPSYIALDVALRFQANLAAISEMLKQDDLNRDKIEASIASFNHLPVQVNQALNNFNQEVLNHLSIYLHTIGRNDPSYDILASVSNQINEALNLLKTS